MKFKYYPECLKCDNEISHKDFILNTECTKCGYKFPEVGGKRR